MTWEKFREVVFAGHPYSTIQASDETAKTYTLAGVKSFYSNEYGAARTHLYVVGQFDIEKVKAAIDKAFGGMKQGPTPIRNVPAISAKRALTVLDRPGAPQSTIYMLLREQDGSSSVWQLAVNGDPERRLVHLRDDKHQVFRTNLDVGANHFYFPIGDRQSDIWTMELRKK